MLVYLTGVLALRRLLTVRRRRSGWPMPAGSRLLRRARAVVAPRPTGSSPVRAAIPRAPDGELVHGSGRRADIPADRHGEIPRASSRRRPSLPADAGGPGRLSDLTQSERIEQAVRRARSVGMTTGSALTVPNGRPAWAISPSAPTRPSPATCWCSRATPTSTAGCSATSSRSTATWSSIRAASSRATSSHSAARSPHGAARSAARCGVTAPLGARRSLPAEATSPLARGRTCSGGSPVSSACSSRSSRSASGSCCSRGPTSRSCPTRSRTRSAARS